MPTYFGPTNIPPIEAITLSVPIIYSDIPGAKEQLGSAAIYVDLKKVDELSIAIYKIFSNKTPINNSTAGCLNPLAFNYNQYADTEGEFLRIARTGV